MCSPSHISACGVCVVGRQAQTLSTVPGPEEAAERVCYCKENVPDICNMSCPCKVWVDAWAPPITASYLIPVLSPVLWFIWDWENAEVLICTQQGIGETAGIYGKQWAWGAVGTHLNRLDGGCSWGSEGLRCQERGVGIESVPAREQITSVSGLGL